LKTSSSKRNLLQEPHPLALDRWLHGLIMLALPTLLGWQAFTFSHQQLLPEAVLALNQAFFIASEQATPPSLETPAQARDLPDDWVSRADTLSQGWYLAVINLNVPPNRLWGIYLPSVNMNAEVYLNDELLGSGGSFDDPVARVWSRPLYFAIPNGMLHPGVNIVQIRLKADPVITGLLGPIYLGPHSELRPSFERHYFLRVSVVEMITGVLFVLALVIGLLWLLRPQEVLCGWFALASLTWALHNLNLLVVNSPLPTRLWDWFFNYMTLGWFTIISTLFIHRYLGIDRPRLEHTFVIIGVLGGLLLLFAPGLWFYWLAIHVWDSLLLSLGLYPLSLVYIHYRRQTDTVSLLLMTAGLTIIIFALHDWLLMNHFISRVEGLYIQYAAPAVVIGFGWLLIRDFVRARDEAERLNRELEQRVAQKTTELEQNYQRLRELENQQLLARERDRIMRDMHDGMGGHLVSTLSMVEAGQVSREQVTEALRAALDDLRLMIDSLDPVEDDLALVLGMYRSRLEPRLTGGPVQLRWQVSDVPPIPNFGPQKVLQVLRILQEAVTNTLKHAHASVLTIGTGSREGRVFIEIKDNGKGLLPQHGKGRGLSNMRQRAQAINGDLELLSTTEGIIVRLWLPVATT